MSRRLGVTLLDINGIQDNPGWSEVRQIIDKLDKPSNGSHKKITKSGKVHDFLDSPLPLDKVDFF